jgi:type III pantothenate kinase
VILTIDLGNSRLSLASVSGRRVRRYVVLERPWTERRVRAAAARLFRGVRPSGAILSSVVPGTTAAVARAVERGCGVRVLRFPKDATGDLRVLPVPKYRVGADRLANAVGALELGRGRDAVIVDVGTAVTVDLVTKDRVFVGGMIAPGPRLAARALAEHTAQLPLVKFRPVKRALGASTRGALESGIWRGMRGLVRALVEAALEASPGARVVVTGGDGRRCLSKSGIRHSNVPGLTHLGLAAAFERRRTP